MNDGAREVDVAAEQTGGFLYGASRIEALVVTLEHGVRARVAASDLPAALVELVRNFVEGDMERVLEDEAAGKFDRDRAARAAAFASVGRATVDVTPEWAASIARAPSFLYV